MMENVVEKIVLVIQSAISREVLERWTFDITQQHGNKENAGNEQHRSAVTVKPLKEIQTEIQAIIRQITARFVQLNSMNNF
jgi:phosphoribosylanthranilate isomerase